MFQAQHKFKVLKVLNFVHIPWKVLDLEVPLIPKLNFFLILVPLTNFTTATISICGDFDVYGTRIITFRFVIICSFTSYCDLMTHVFFLLVCCCVFVCVSLCVVFRLLLPTLPLTQLLIRNELH
jgi:hypothetical protein